MQVQAAHGGDVENGRPDHVAIVERENDIGIELPLHLDGARIWNAATALGVPPAEFGTRCDTLACCLSKGLGCPAGALLVGDRGAIDEARWYRKMFGGGMRQAGILAAAGLHALDHELPRLGEDHQLARELARELAALDRPWTVQAPESNMVLLRCHTPGQCLDQVGRLAEAGILAYDIGPRKIRLVCHRDLPGTRPPRSGSAWADPPARAVYTRSMVLKPSSRIRGVR